MLRPSLALSAGVALLLVAPSSGSGGPDAAHPVAVGSSRLAAAPPAVMERAVEAAWLRDEAVARGLPVDGELRVRIADLLAGPSAGGIPGAFSRYHERHRAATHCLAAATDPYADRCIDQPAAPAGRCRWMGEATLCRVGAGHGRHLWLVVHRDGGSPRYRRHEHAVAALRRIYLRAREGRARAAREARAARARRMAAADRRRRRAVARAARRRSAALRRAHAARRSAARRARLAEPRLSAGSLRPARRACERLRRDAELYRFGLGMQDPVGQANGLLAARARLRRGLSRAAADRIDVRKLDPLLLALRSGDRELRRLRAAREAADVFAARGRYRRATRRTGRLASRLGLPDCAR